MPKPNCPRTLATHNLPNEVRPDRLRQSNPKDIPCLRIRVRLEVDARKRIRVRRRYRLRGRAGREPEER